MKNNNKKLYFPKLINMLGFISYFIPLEFKFTNSDNFFNFQILGFEDNSCIGFSFFKFYFDEIEIHLNILFFIHLRYTL